MPECAASPTGRHGWATRADGSLQCAWCDRRERHAGERMCVSCRVEPVEAGRRLCRSCGWCVGCRKRAVSRPGLCDACYELHADNPVDGYANDVLP